MKKLTFAILAASILSAVAHDSAFAWFKWNLGGSLNTGISWGGVNLNYTGQSQECPRPLPPCVPPPSNVPGYMAPITAPAQPVANPIYQQPSRVMPIAYPQANDFFLPEWIGD